MKTKLIAAMLLLAGLVQGQDTPPVSIGELREQAMALRLFDGIPPVADVAALVRKIKATATAPVATGVASTLTDEERAYRDAVEQFTLLMYRRIGYFNARDFAVQHNHFGCITNIAIRDKRWDEALPYAQQWLNLAPDENDRKALLWKVKAYNNQDVTGEINTFVALLASEPLTKINRETAVNLLDAWCFLSEKPYPEWALQALIDTLADKQEFVRDKSLVRIHGAFTKAKEGVNVNQELVGILSSVNGLIADVGVLNSIMNSFVPANSTNEEVSAFYDKVLQAVEVNPQTVVVIRKLVDQKAKLALTDP